MSDIPTQIFGKARAVFLRPSDDGLDMVFSKEDGQRVKISFDWVQVADMALRVDSLGEDALTLMQAGLDPYNAEHRSSFFVAGLQVLNDDDQGGK